MPIEINFTNRSGKDLINLNNKIYLVIGPLIRPGYLVNGPIDTVNGSFVDQ